MALPPRARSARDDTPRARATLAPGPAVPPEPDARPRARPPRPLAAAALRGLPRARRARRLPVSALRPRAAAHRVLGVHALSGAARARRPLRRVRGRALAARRVLRRGLVRRRGRELGEALEVRGARPRGP